MHSNIFVKALPLLKESKLNIDIDAFIDFLGHYKQNDWMYPTAIHRRLKIDIREIYKALEILSDNGLLEQYLEIYCPNCKRYTGDFFKTIGDIPKEIYCENCDEEILNPLEHAVVIYKVL
ncbi:hypothetical protein SAMN05216540_1285 [Butyrivibrio sp. M55]|nr:hypothetical protein SAMN05216540_1285 [Butyrivibrio sp. M55]